MSAIEKMRGLPRTEWMDAVQYKPNFPGYYERKLPSGNVILSYFDGEAWPRLVQQDLPWRGLASYRAWMAAVEMRAGQR